MQILLFSQQRVFEGAFNVCCKLFVGSQIRNSLAKTISKRELSVENSGNNNNMNQLFHFFDVLWSFSTLLNSISSSKYFLGSYQTDKFYSTAQLLSQIIRRKTTSTSKQFSPVTSYVSTKMNGCRRYDTTRNLIHITNTQCFVFKDEETKVYRLIITGCKQNRNDKIHWV